MTLPVPSDIGGKDGFHTLMPTKCPDEQTVPEKDALSKSIPSMNKYDFDKYIL